MLTHSVEGRAAQEADPYPERAGGDEYRVGEQHPVQRPHEAGHEKTHKWRGTDNDTDNVDNLLNKKHGT